MHIETTLVEVTLETQMPLVMVLKNLSDTGVEKVLSRFITGLGEDPARASIAIRPLPSTLLPDQVERETLDLIARVQTRTCAYLQDETVVAHYVPIVEDCGAYMFVPANCLEGAL